MTFEAKIILNSDEKAFFQEMAKKEGLSVSNFLRKKLGMPLLQKANNFTTNNPSKKILDKAKKGKNLPFNIVGSKKLNGLKIVPSHESVIGDIVDHVISLQQTTLKKS